MATGPEHYREAEAKLQQAYNIARPDSGHSDEEATTLIGLALQRAQVHATLALAAATALNHGGGEGLHSTDWDAWSKAAGEAAKPKPAQ